MNLIKLLTKAETSELVSLRIEIDNLIAKRHHKNILEASKIQIKDLSISTRLRNLLKSVNVSHIHQLNDLRIIDLSKKRNCGKQTLIELEQLMRKYGVFQEEE